MLMIHSQYKPLLLNLLGKPYFLHNSYKSIKSGIKTKVIETLFKLLKKLIFKIEYKVYKYYLSIGYIHLSPTGPASFALCGKCTSKCTIT